jgi:signal transduction histidine kinase/CheY-like chemotaxis protein/ligand-binding sensor domain-containing protein
MPVWSKSCWNSYLSYLKNLYLLKLVQTISAPSGLKTGKMKNSIRYLIFSALLFLLTIKTFSQKILDPEFVPPDVRWDNFLTKGGEAGQKTISLMIDSKGFLWSGTETGLYRFDGARYVEYGLNKGDNKGFKGLTVTCIFEDSEGTIWVGTSEALNRLDQKAGTFLHYFPDSVNNKGTGNFIRSINEDKEGILWIRTGKDIYSFNRQTKAFCRYPTDPHSWYPRNEVYTVESQHYAEDSKGNKWFVTYSALYRFSSHDRSFRLILPDTLDDKLSDVSQVSCVSTDKKGTVWIGTQSGGLLKWDEIHDKPEKINMQPPGKNSEAFNSVSAILPGIDGSLWCFGNGSFSKYDPENNSIGKYIFLYRHRTVYENQESPVWIDDAFQYSNGTIWFLNKRAGLMFRFDPGTEKLCLYRTPTFMVYQCVMDSTGSFWFSAIRNNILRLVTGQLPFFTIRINHSASTAQTNRNYILEDDQNNVWLLLNYGTYVIKSFSVGSSLITHQLSFSDGDTTKESGFKDSKGNFWFGSFTGKITKYNPVTGSSRNFYLPQRDPAGSLFWIPLIREDKAGNIWVATSRSGIYRLAAGIEKPEHIMDFIKDQQGINQAMLIDFHIDSYGQFWMLTSESLLLVGMPEKKITDYTNYGDDIFTSVRSNVRIREDIKGNIWILNSRSGLYLFSRQNGSFTKFDVVAEGPDTEYYDLLADRTGKLWIGHNKGISILDVENGHTRFIRTSKLQYDLQSMQINSGHVLYVNDNQLCIFYEDPPLNNTIPPVYITQLLINGTDFNQVYNDNKEISSVNKIELPFRLNTLRIEFAALNYLNPEENRYRYYMAKRDKDTVTVSQGTAAEYKSLPPGKYKFWVTGSNNDGLWNAVGASLDIRIRPPWFRSGLAYIFYLIAFAACLAGYIRLRIRHLKREKEKLKSQIESATAELEVKNRQLAEIDRLKTRFFTDISHEIRTPLTMITGPLETIAKEEMLSSRMAGMIDLMKRNAKRLMHLVNQLLDIARLDAGKMKITLVKDDIVKCLRILVYEFLSVAESKQIKYIADLPEKPFITWFDRDKIEKIVSNLLSNAFKYTPVGGTVFCTVKAEPDLNKESHSLLQIKVSDSGPGISKENQNRIFDRFFRIEDHHGTEGYGTGIGLSLVQEFVSLLHGEIKVNSTPGKGSEFCATLPLGKEHLSTDEYILTRYYADLTAKPFKDHVEPKLEMVSGKQTTEEKIRILIVEDNEDLRNYIKESLTDNYIILEADNGRSGMNTAFTMMPDLIVTDIMMPDVDGIKLCTQLKNDERTSHIPIIMLTAKATSEDKITGLRTGADDYIIKPFKMPELSTRISNLLALRDKLRLKYDRFHILGIGKETPISVDDEFIARVVNIINSNLNDYRFDVGLLCELVGISKTHLNRKLKILTGLPAGIMIRNIRLEKGAELLRRKSGNFTEIANSVGISNPANFTKSFRIYFGVSPKEYEKKFSLEE